MVRVALYGRNSKPPKGWKPTYAGEEAPGSWQVQLQQLRAWADRNGYDVVLEAHDTASGRDANRPGWQRVLGAARGHHVHKIAVTRLSRCMRNTRHFLDAADELMGLGVELEVLEQPAASVRGKDDAMGRAFRTMGAVFAQLERDLTIEQSEAVMRVGDDGRIYGPRSDRPAGRPQQYGEGHKFRVRGGRQVHDKARCQACMRQGSSA